MIIQFCGLSGSGKTTLARNVQNLLLARGLAVEIIDGDEYRKVLCADLGFSKEDRNTNIRRLAFVADRFSTHNIIAIICAINPYEAIREEIRTKYRNVKTVFVHCNMETLMRRDTKQLYKRALLPDSHIDKITNLTGVNDPFEIPLNLDLTIDSSIETEKESAQKLADFIINVMDQSNITAAEV